jgi:hypothetical protein
VGLLREEKRARPGVGAGNQARGYSHCFGHQTLEGRQTLEWGAAGGKRQRKEQGAARSGCQGADRGTRRYRGVSR